MVSLQQIRTPCIGVCSTGIGDSVCRGCKRFDHEVIAWNSYDQSQKAAIDARLASLLSRLVDERFVIFDPGRLVEQLQLQQIPYRGYRDANCGLYELLRAGANQIEDTAVFGFSRRPLVARRTLSSLRAEIDAELYSLSVAHYERYIVANSKKASCVSE